jgi:predicted CoA-substrate-specific enzyme activase
VNQNTIFAGVDVGASATKAALINGDKELVGFDVRKTGVSFETCAQEAMEAAMASCNPPPPKASGIFSTGYGRHNVVFSNETRTEIACHARAAYHFFPRHITVVDVGGQDNKIIHVNAKGMRDGFKMNRKCAAGTGAFLEEVAQRMDIPLGEIDALARKASHVVHMGSYCTVFTKTEILAHIRAGEKVPDIVAGLIESVVKRIVEMDPLTGEVVLSGGVIAHNPIMAEMLAQHIGHPVHILPHAQLAGAFGAALLAADASERTPVMHENK